MKGALLNIITRAKPNFLTPAALVTNIQGRVDGLRSSGGQIWAINRFSPIEADAIRNISFTGVVVSEPQLIVYEPAILAQAAIDLASQAVDAAYIWAGEAKAQGVLDPDPRTARAVALQALGDSLAAVGRPEEAVGPYQTAVDIFPGWG